MPSFMDRLKLSYNILRNNRGVDVGPEQMITSTVPSSIYSGLRYDTNNAVLSPIKTRIAIDASSIPVNHVLVNELGQFIEKRQSELNDRLTIMANVDQSGAAFIQDAVMTMLEDGACALVPIEISGIPSSGTYDILSMRVATITEWFNYSVRVSVYNELTGDRVERVLPKSFVAICYNPLYAVMNEPNSTLRRLIDKLALLDVADARLYSAQLDLVLQLPYTLKNERREAEAARRLESLEEQLYDRKYGVAYIDATEKVTQLNRPVTNTLLEAVEGLTSSLHSQLGLTPSIFAGTATEEELVAYNNRTILPIMKSLTDGMVGAFFSRTAIRQGNSVMVFPSLFKMAPLETTAEAVDKLTRNAIMTSNEVRAVFGLVPSEDPDADALRNKNLNQADQGPPGEQPKEEEKVPAGSNGSQIRSKN
jgi:hypothetical protein